MSAPIRPVVPSGFDLECMVVACLLRGKRAAWDRIATILGNNDFLEEGPRWVFEAIRLFERERIPFTVLDVIELIEMRADIDVIGGRAFVFGLEALDVNPGLIAEFGALMVERARRTRLCALGEKLVEYGSDPQLPVSGIANWATRSLAAILPPWPTASAPAPATVAQTPSEPAPEIFQVAAVSIPPTIH